MNTVPPYAELHCLSNFSFLRGASHPEELVARTCELGYSAIALTDECSVAGVVRGHLAAKEYGLKLLIGSEFALADGPRLVLLAPDRAAYGDLCQLITVGRRAAEKGAYRLTVGDLARYSNRCLALWVPGDGTAEVGRPPPNLPPLTRGEGFELQAGEGIVGLGEGIGEEVGVREVGEGAGGASEVAARQLESLRELFPDRLWIVVELLRDGRDQETLAALQALGERYGVPLVAAGNVQMHKRRRKRLHDVMTAIRLGTTVQEAGYALAPNGENCLRPRATLARLYPPELLAETVRIAERCTFSLDELRYEYPDEIVPAGETPASYLRRLTEEGLCRRWPQGEPSKVRALVERELALIAELRYEPYFLTVYDIVHYARSRDILCQGRGSAANSAVCFCLGITEVDPDRIDTLFERFVSKERNEPPDIDVDFEHERREEVIQYIYGKYGRERAALAATVITYRMRSAVRDVGKALGFSLEQVDRLAKNFQWWDDGGSLPVDKGGSARPDSVPLPVSEGEDGDIRPPPSVPPLSGGREEKHGGREVSQRESEASRRQRRAHRVFHERLREAGFDPDNPRLQLLVELVQQLRGFPRHLSQHVGGFVIARDSLSRLVPIENAAMPERTVIQWDKDDIDALGLLKVDCLGLGMLTAIRKSFELIERWDGRKLTPATVPAEDPAVYQMITQADTVGVFQIESRAQMSMLPRLKPRCFYDLVIEIAIVRPGPIQGNMVHPYLRRRQGRDSVSYPSEEVRGVLERTLGVPIFQEQVIKLAMVAAGFSAGEADGLRRAMAAWARRGGLERYERRLIEGMRERGYSDEYARQIYAQIQGFGEYGFPESHSASFALLAYVSAWLKCHEPAAFLAALLNSQPMGFYAPAQLVQDARRHGVEVRPVDVRYSDWDCALEAIDAGFKTPLPSPPPASGGRGFKGVPAVRLGLRQVKGLSRAGAERLVTARSNATFADVIDMVRRAGLDARDRAALAAAGALKGLAGHRHRARWAVAGIEPERPLLLKETTIPEAIPLLRAPSEVEDVVADYAHVGLTLGRHPIALLREELTARGSLSAVEINRVTAGRHARTTGLVVCRQHPGSANGVIFITLEDETGQTNVIVWKNVVERHRRELAQARLLSVEGEVQREDGVQHIIARRLVDRSALLGELMVRSRDFR